MSCLPKVGTGDGDRISGWSVISGSTLAVWKFAFGELIFEEKETFGGGT